MVLLPKELATLYGCQNDKYETKADIDFQDYPLTEAPDQLGNRVTS